MKRIGLFALSIYMGISPMYWLPLVPPILLSAVKALAFGIVVFTSLIVMLSRKRIIFPGGGVALAIFIGLLLLTVPGTLYGVPEAGAYRLFNIFQIVAFILSCRALIDGSEWQSVVKRSVLLFMGIASVCLFAMLVVPSYPSPLVPGLVLSQTGFGGLRTGWSPAMALYLPWVLLGSATIANVWLVMIGSAVLVSNQVLVGGRSGLLATAVVLVAWQFGKGRLSSYLLGIAVTVALVLVTLLFPDLLRLQMLEGAGAITFDDLNKFSSGRISQYVSAFPQLLESPWVGAGFGNVLFGESGNALHNEFLRLALEGGVLLGIASLLPIFLVARRLFLTRQNISMPATFTLLAGLVVAQFEPAFIYGNFNISALWWFSFVVCFLPHAAIQKVDQLKLMPERSVHL